VQMKGRGTRKHTFKYIETWETKEKEQFLLLDFFWNCEYFEKDFDYDKKIPLPSLRKDDAPIDTPPPPAKIDAGLFDQIKTETIIHIGKEWMKIDRELYKKSKCEQFEYILQKSETIQEAYESGWIDWVEEVLKTEVFHQPNEYWNPEMIRKSYEEQNRTHRRIGLKEMISKGLGLIKRFETRDERIDTEWQKFIVSERPALESAEKLNLLKELFETYLTDEYFRKIIDQKCYWELSNYPLFDLSDIKIIWVENLNILSHYSHEYLHSAMNEFHLITK